MKKDKAQSRYDKEYSFGAFIKKHWILLIVLIAIPIIICAIFIPILCNNSINIWDLGSFLGGLLAYTGTALLGAVSMWQNEKLKFENDKNIEAERVRAEKEKQILIENNKKIVYDNARLAILPIFSINKVPYSIHSNIHDTPDYQTHNERVYGYSEGDSWYFAIALNEKEITIQTKESVEIQRYKQSALACKRDSNGVRIMCEKEDAYIPYIIKNIGRANANKFSFAIYKEGCSDKKLSKHILARPFSLDDEMRLDFYIPNLEFEAIYWLELTYDDLLGNHYQQKDYIKIQKDDSQISIDFPQTLQEQNNG